ncbi:MAG: aminotransferase class V-fold PLP-dependent enzyme, partial [Caldilineaceae bacterium]|nr:aminotransferase class V-fold PLP-dependent enzyme [Caldilineaceae bacterium]
MPHRGPDLACPGASRRADCTCAGGWQQHTRHGFAEAIDERTLLVSITHICFRNGSMLDVPAIVELAHRRGALVLLDSYQALGALPVDVRALDVDFLVGGVLKYLLASGGLAYLFVRKSLLQTLQPTTSGWFAQENIFAMDNLANRPAPGARRFEGGTPPVPNLYAAIAGIKLVQSVGLDRIQQRIRLLTDAIKEGALQRGLRVVTPMDPAQHGALIA